MTRPGDPRSGPGGAPGPSGSRADEPRTHAPHAPLADRLTRLARVTSELVRADAGEDVGRIVVDHGAEAVGAMVASMVMLCDDQVTVRLAALSGGIPVDEDIWRTFPLAARTPSAEAIRTGRRRLVVGREAIMTAYPDIPDRGALSVMTLPLNSGDRTLGAIALLFPDERELDASEVEFLDILADTCAQSLDRIAAQLEASRQSTMLVFLAEAATELASSLDYEATLANVARMAVPAFADWCAVDVVDDGRLRRLAVEHVDPAKVQLAHDLAERYPTPPDAPHGAWHVMRTGRSELIPDITDELLVAGARDAAHLDILRALHLRSAMTVPLVVRERVIGVITWVAAESERHFTADDLTLAEELAKRAAISLDNAELHSQTLAAAVQLQQAVLPQTLSASDGWEVAHLYKPAGRTDVGGDFYDVIELDDGRLVLFVGDVMGRGVGAAAAMAQVRAAVRAYAALDPDPDVVLTRLDRMYDLYQSDQLVTLLYLLVDPARDELVVGNAGHPPPLLLRGDGTLVQLALADGAPLGVGLQDRRQASMTFAADDTVVAFTDGLIERRGEDITDGQLRLAAAVACLAGRPLAAALPGLVDEVGDSSRDDDVAVLAVRRRD
ncbi:MAG: Serine phosphatase RsbU, regulator of sigma subunit [uncultured Nocardioidaceae bacterium]|uniref:Serine phosphatase RsbU, regulator of sigma subunit n=1 Tax=uncultured Nocardioidaceae bacterium TaxID=253824 RepID=A0A6J4KXN8_9ACTN|nr:MAG: Serine phosphatase RsbU, regulator of sigma subunit [uncultured Nocardioidaceae bacterium]